MESRPAVSDAQTAIGIVGHPTRSTAAKALARSTRAAFISFDNGLGCDRNHINVLEHLEAIPSTYAVVLEDDAVPVADFTSQLQQCLPFAPSRVVSLYLGRQRPPQFQDAIAAAVTDADQQDASWIVASRMMHAVGYAIHTSLLGSLLDFDSYLPIDEHISAWAQIHGHVVSYTWPSLVDHADVPTIVAHRDGEPRPPGRVAWRTGRRDTWTTTSVPVCV